MLIDIKGAFTLPPASSELLTISNSEKNIVAGAKRHSNIAPISFSDLGNNNAKISFEKAISPTVIGAVSADVSFKALSSASSSSVIFSDAMDDVNMGKNAMEIGVIIAIAKLNIGTARVV